MATRAKSKKKCEICHDKFPVHDLYPLALVRNNVLDVAEKVYPDIDREGFVCLQDLRKISSMHFEEILKQEKGVLTELEQEVLQSISKHRLLSENVNEEFEESLKLGERLADRIAYFGGSWTFIMIFAFVLFSWMGINSLQIFTNQPFDPYPYIFLNLILSCLAAIQAPVIMMSQNRQAAKDRLSQESDYQTNLKAELQIRQLNTRLELFSKHHWQKMAELVTMHEELLRELKKDD